MPRADKKRKLSRISGIGGATDSALLKLLRELKADPTILDDDYSATTIRAAAYLVLNQVGVELSLQMVPNSQFGRTFIWVVASLPLLLPALVTQSLNFETLFRERLLVHSNAEPWSLILYGDEVTPGDLLRPEGDRKVMAFYAAFREFGAEALSKTESWMPLALLRTEVLKEVDGGTSAALRALLEHMFLGLAGVGTAGIVLPFNGGEDPQILRIALTNLLGDEDFINQAWSSKGSSGLVICFNCKNITGSRTDLQENDVTSYLRDAGESDASLFDVKKDAEHWDLFDTLAREKLTLGIGKFGEKEKFCGLSYNPRGVLASHPLRQHVRPASITTYDSQHCALANGIVGTEIGQFFLAAKEEADSHPARLHGKYIWQHMSTLLSAAWKWPTHRGAQCRSAHSWFNESRRVASEKAGHFKGQASEIIAIYPMVRFYAEKHLGDVPELAQSRDSLMKCFGVLDILMDYKNGKTSRRGC